MIYALSAAAAATTGDASLDRPVAGEGVTEAKQGYKYTSAVLVYVRFDELTLTGVSRGVIDFVALMTAVS